MGGRNHLLAVVKELGLVVPTALLPHRLGGALSIDHIAVGREQRLVDAQRIRAGGLSDHDAYVVSLAAT
jgi:hypothetical protein